MNYNRDSSAEKIILLRSEKPLLYVPMKISTQNLDHLGLVAAMCEEIDIARVIDDACGQQAKNKHMTYGQTTVAMILNGLGFVGRTLYM